MNANSFPDGRRGRVLPGDVRRVAEYSASTLPRPGPGAVGRRFPQGTIVTALPARARGGSAILPLTMVDASAKDVRGNAHPGRVRVYNGWLGNLLPAEMKSPDAVLPDGTDSQCYLTMQNGTNYVSGKVSVDASTGRYTAASVYRAATVDAPDGSYAYLPIGNVIFDGTKLTISQFTTGNQQLFITFSVDGTIITPTWTPTAP